MRELRRLRSKCRVIPIQLPNPFMNVRIPTPNIPYIRFEMLNVYSIKSNYRCIQPNIRFGDVLAVKIGAFGGGEVFFDVVERREEFSHGFGICFLCSCEAASVDAIINTRINPFV